MVTSVTKTDLINQLLNFLINNFIM